MPERKREKIDKGLFLVDGRVYMERTYMGKIVRRKALAQGENAIKRGQPTKALRDEFRKFCETIDNRRFEELEASKQRSASLTIKDFIEEYRTAAKSQYASHGAPRPATVEINVGALLIVIHAAGLTEVDRVDRIERNTIQKYIDSRCSGGSDRARISAWSTVAHARSCFARWALDKYQQAGLKIPTSSGWPIPPKNKLLLAYERPQAELTDKTMAWYNQLETSNPPMWAAVTLMLQLAMRPISAANMTWDNFQNINGRWVVRYIPSKTEGRTKRPRPVIWPLHGDLYERLRKAGGPVYVVKGANLYQRYAYYVREINKELREIGWERQRYQKACYELRKLCVDTVFNSMGAERASQISGDNISTVLNYYADPNKSGFDGINISKIIEGSEDAGSVSAASP
jgi:integrase